MSPATDAAAGWGWPGCHTRGRDPALRSRLARPAGQGEGGSAVAADAGTGWERRAPTCPCCQARPTPRSEWGQPPQHPKITLRGGGGRQLGCLGTSLASNSPAGLRGSLVAPGVPVLWLSPETPVLGSQCSQGPSIMGFTGPSFLLGSCSCHLTDLGGPHLCPREVTPQSLCWELALILQDAEGLVPPNPACGHLRPRGWPWSPAVSLGEVAPAVFLSLLPISVPLGVPRGTEGLRSGDHGGHEGWTGGHEGRGTRGHRGTQGNTGGHRGRGLWGQVAQETGG